ncbi:hypothetical protein DEQ92_20815, partial [Haloferax sp. Atlit-6N]
NIYDNRFLDLNRAAVRVADTNSNADPENQKVSIQDNTIRDPVRPGDSWQGTALVHLDSDNESGYNNGPIYIKDNRIDGLDTDPDPDTTPVAYGIKAPSTYDVRNGLWVDGNSVENVATTPIDLGGASGDATTFQADNFTA